MKRILCPFHKESTPSCVIYPTHYVCYGCGARGPLNDIGMHESNGEYLEPEDIEESVKYIKSLPKQDVRGLKLHADGNRYYVVWPFNDFYKGRAFEADVTPKYLGPRGVKKPIFWTQWHTNSDVLIVIEGEINALSIKPALGCDIMSPGSATDFISKTTLNYFTDDTSYDKVLVITDADAAGRDANLRLQYRLRCLGFKTKGFAMKKDFNEILVNYGEEEVKEEFRRNMEGFSEEWKVSLRLCS